MGFVRKVFLTGFMVLAPLVLSIYIIVALFNFADSFLGRYVNFIVKKYLGFNIPGIGIVFGIIIIFILGIIGLLFRGRILNWLEKFFLSIPLLKQIYPPIKQIVNFFISQEKLSFKKVALIEYPRKGVYSLGFVTKESSIKFKEKLNKELLNVFIPSTPGPFTGVFLVVPKEEVIFLDMSVEEGLKLIVSGGVLNPEDLKLKEENL